MLRIYHRTDEILGRSYIIYNLGRLYLENITHNTLKMHEGIQIFYKEKTLNRRKKCSHSKNKLSSTILINKIKSKFLILGNCVIKDKDVNNISHTDIV